MYNNQFNGAGNGNNGQWNNFDPFQPQRNRPIESDTFSVCAIVLGIMSVMFSCCCYAFSIVAGITAVVLGIIALNKKENRRSFAIVGIVAGLAGMSFAIILFAFEIYMRYTGIYQELVKMYLEPETSSDIWKSIQ